MDTFRFGSGGGGGGDERNELNMEMKSKEFQNAVRRYSVVQQAGIGTKDRFAQADFEAGISRKIEAERQSGHDIPIERHLEGDKHNYLKLHQGDVAPTPSSEGGSNQLIGSILASGTSHDISSGTTAENVEGAGAIQAAHSSSKADEAAETAPRSRMMSHPHSIDMLSSTSSNEEEDEFETKREMTEAIARWKGSQSPH